MMKKSQVVIRRENKSGSGRAGDTSYGSNSSTTTSSSTVRNIRYAECQRNHAASIGGYATDGCREFMASGVEGTSDALICAACGCHRNFHRREVETEVVCEYSPPDSSRQ